MKIWERDELHTTNDRQLFNKLNRRKVLGCPICGPNSGCNGRAKKKEYGGTHSSTFDPRRVRRTKRTRYPNWKLATTNRKQWQEKNIRKRYRTWYWSAYEYTCTEFVFVF